MEVIGKGGFGTVYRAMLEGEGGFSKEVAVKILNTTVDQTEEAVRLRDEARLLGLLRHRAILQVDGLFQLAGRWAVVTEYVRGLNLFEVARHKRIPLTVALEVAGEVAGGVHVAYNSPGPDGQPLCLIHRDIKLSNIQLTPAGEVKLLDFGIARADFSTREAETQQLLLGSLSYMSPERLDMRDGSEGDIYALGVVICEAISQKKFKKTSANKGRHEQHVQASIAKVRSRVGPAFDEVEPLVRSMLAYDPADRPTPKEVERQCRELRAKLTGPWLADWAEEALPGLERRELEADDDTLVGQILLEGNGRPQDRAVGAARAGARVGFAAGAVALLVMAAGVLGAGAAVWTTRMALFGDAPEPVPTVEPPEPAPAVAAAPEPEPEPEPEPAPAPEPEPVVEPAPAPAPAPKPPPRPEPAGTAAEAPAGSLVTAGAFSTWLGTHEDWRPAQAASEGRADANYLRDWTDGQPPDASAPLTNVTWWAARAFCRSRGGLAGLDQQPHTWTETSGPFQEWRTSGDRASWRRFDGATSTAVRRTDANAFTGFRCAR